MVGAGGVRVMDGWCMGGMVGVRVVYGWCAGGVRVHYVLKGLGWVFQCATTGEPN